VISLRKHKDAASPLPAWIPPQLCQPVEIAPPGPQWLHEIKLDGFRMAARIERGRVKLLTRTGLDWSDKYPSVIEAVAKVRAHSAYLDGEFCGVIRKDLTHMSDPQSRRFHTHVCTRMKFERLHKDAEAGVAASHAV
jgi:ATP-dependent DNA ligase